MGRWGAEKFGSRYALWRTGNQNALAKKACSGSGAALGALGWLCQGLGTRRIYKARTLAAARGRQRLCWVLCCRALLPGLHVEHRTACPELRSKVIPAWLRGAAGSCCWVWRWGCCSSVCRLARAAAAQERFSEKVEKVQIPRVLEDGLPGD